MSSVNLPEGCKPIVRGTDRDATIANITPPAIVEEAPAAAAPAGKGGKAAPAKAAAKPAAKK
jgi:hypothetical protein